LGRLRKEVSAAMGCGGGSGEGGGKVDGGPKGQLRRWPAKKKAMKKEETKGWRTRKSPLGKKKLPGKGDRREVV